MQNPPKDIPEKPVPGTENTTPRQDFFEFLGTLRYSGNIVISDMLRDEEARIYPDELTDDYDESISDKFGR